MPTSDTLREQLNRITTAGDRWGETPAPTPQRILIEFVSANPNAPLSVAHGRGGAIGDVLANLLTATGHTVEREYYVNDATSASSLKIFAYAVLTDYYALHHRLFPKTDAAYPEAFARHIAQQLNAEDGDRFLRLTQEDAVAVFQDRIAEVILSEQKETLQHFGIEFDNWLTESSLLISGAVRETLHAFQDGKHLREQSDAVWLQTKNFGDTLDRVLVRVNGTRTYLANDLAYHRNKFERGFDRLIDVWTEEHRGYIGRTRAGLQALGFPAQNLQVVFYQPVRFWRDGNELHGGKHFRDLYPLAELMEELSPDSIRFAFLLAAPNNPLDLDRETLQAASPQNPLTVLQDTLNLAAPSDDTSVKETDTETVEELTRFPQIVKAAAETLAPQQLAQYTLKLARHVSATPVSPATLAATQTVLRNASRLLGLSFAPKRQE